jgi:hypothetical protein
MDGNSAESGGLWKKPAPPIEEAPIFGLRRDVGAFAEDDPDEIALKKQAAVVSDAKAFLKAVQEQGVRPELNMADVTASINRAKEKRDAAQAKLEELQKEVARKRGYS